MKAIHLILTLAAAAMLSTACGVLSSTTPEQAAEDARVEKLVKQRLADRKYQIDIDYMQPLRGAGQVVTTPYSITVNGKHLVSYLPYMGVAYSVPYGGGKGLNFESEIDEYVERRKGERTLIEFVTDNGEDYLLYQLTVFENGRTDVHVQSRNRESIDFRGTLDPDFDPDAKEE